MRFWILVTAFCISTSSVVHAQWLERTIWLPDSTSGIVMPELCCYNRARDEVYVSGAQEPCVLRVDCASGRTTGRAALLSAPRDLVVKTDGSELYVLTQDDQVVFIDCATMQPVGLVPVPSSLYRLYSNPLMNRLYGTSGSNVIVIDCGLRRVVAELPVGNPGPLLYDLDRNQLYVADQDSERILVVDCVTNQTVGYFAGIPHAAAIALHGPLDKLYVWDYSGQELAVFDCSTGVRIASIPVGLPTGVDERRHIALDTGRDRLYCTSENGLVVIDCSADAIITTIETISSLRDVSACPELGRAWAVEGGLDSLLVIDATGDSALKRLPVGHSAHWLAASPTSAKVFVGNYYGADLSVIDAAHDSLLGNLVLGVPVEILVPAGWANRVYAAGYNRIAAIDPAAGRVERVIELPAGTALVAAGQDPLTGQILFTDTSSRILTLDPTCDSIIQTFVIDSSQNGGYLPCVNTVNGRTYAASADGNGLYVINPAGHTVRAHILPGVGFYQVLFSPAANKLYCLHGSSNRVSVVDGDRDSLLAIILLSSSPSPLCLVSALNRVYVGDAQRILAIDGATNRTVDTILFAGSATSLCYSPYRNELYTLTHSRDSIVVIDLVSGSVERYIWSAMEITDMVCDTIADRLYCRNVNSQYLQVIDCADGAVLACPVLESVTRVMAYDPDMRRTYVGGWDRSAVSVLRDTTGASVAEHSSLSVELPTATVLNRVLWVPAGDDMRLIDATGRVVMALAPGANDLGRLGAGVYFMVARGSRPVKVVIPR